MAIKSKCMHKKSITKHTRTKRLLRWHWRETFNSFGLIQGLSPNSQEKQALSAIFPDSLKTISVLFHYMYSDLCLAVKSWYPNWYIIGILPLFSCLPNGSDYRVSQSMEAESTAATIIISQATVQFQVRGKRRSGAMLAHQDYSRCCTRGESEESTVHKLYMRSSNWRGGRGWFWRPIWEGERFEVLHEKFQFRGGGWRRRFEIVQS